MLIVVAYAKTSNSDDCGTFIPLELMGASPSYTVPPVQAARSSWLIVHVLIIQRPQGAPARLMVFIVPARLTTHTLVPFIRLTSIAGKIQRDGIRHALHVTSSRPHFFNHYFMKIYIYFCVAGQHSAQQIRWNCSMGGAAPAHYFRCLARREDWRARGDAEASVVISVAKKTFAQ